MLCDDGLSTTGARPLQRRGRLRRHDDRRARRRCRATLAGTPNGVGCTPSFPRRTRRRATNRLERDQANDRCDGAGLTARARRLCASPPNQCQTVGTPNGTTCTPVNKAKHRRRATTPTSNDSTATTATDRARASPATTIECEADTAVRHVRAERRRTARSPPQTGDVRRRRALHDAATTSLRRGRLPAARRTLACRRSASSASVANGDRLHRDVQRTRASPATTTLRPRRAVDRVRRRRRLRGRGHTRARRACARRPRCPTAVGCVSTSAVAGHRVRRPRPVHPPKTSATARRAPAAGEPVVCGDGEVCDPERRVPRHALHVVRRRRRGLRRETARASTWTAHRPAASTRAEDDVRLRLQPGLPRARRRLACAASTTTGTCEAPPVVAPRSRTAPRRSSRSPSLPSPRWSSPSRSPRSRAGRRSRRPSPKPEVVEPQPDPEPQAEVEGPVVASGGSTCAGGPVEGFALMFAGLALVVIARRRRSHGRGV